ncbi:hypothetical protein FRC11_015066, partial [Ceratobasidium sp. 423]
MNPEDSTLSKMVKTALRYERTEQMHKEETKKAERLKSDYMQTKLTRPDKAQNSRARSRSPERSKGDKKDTKDKRHKEKRTEKLEKHNKPTKPSKPNKPADSSERKLTPEEKEQYQAEGRCFKCGDVRHKSCDCLKKNRVKPSHILSSTVHLKAMDDLANAIDQIKCSTAKVKATKSVREQTSK